MHCERCNGEFKPANKGQRFCSRACGLANTAELRRRRQQFTCEVCGAVFERRNCEASSAKYCSRACWNVRNNPREKQCEYCGEPFQTYHDDQQYCSRHCARKSKTGPNATAWKDGSSLDKERARFGDALKKWRIAVYLRDNRTCQHCGVTSRRIHAHHIKPWAQYPELRFDVANGITLCESCHGKVHGKDFSNRRIKECPDCGKPVKGRGTRCSSCAIKHWHAQRVQQ